MIRVQLLAGGLVTLSALASQTSPSVVDQVESRYNDAKTLSVHFVETFTVQGHRRRPEAGVLTLRKSGKMRWDYQQPAGKLFVSDGKMIFLYTARDNRVQKVKLKETEDLRAPLAFLLGRVDLRKDFRDLQTSPTDRGTQLRANAKSNRMAYRSIEMLVGPNGSIADLRVAGVDESVIEYQFTDERLNPPVADELFHFTIPPGAEIVDAMNVQTEGAN